MDPNHLIQLAEIRYGAGRMPQSIQALRELLELHPERPELRIRLAELHHEAGNIPEARQVWLAAANELREKSRSAGNEEALTQAIEVYSRMRELFPHDLEVLARLTESYRTAGPDDAYMTHALELAGIYTEAGELDRATGILEGLAARFPANVPIRERLAAGYIHAGNPLDAVRCFKMLFEIHQASRRYDLAKAALDQALSLRPDDPLILQQLGEICLRLNQKGDGLQHLGAAAMQLKEAGRFDESRQIVERTLKIDPTNLETRRLLGSVCEAMGDIPGAISNYSAAARDWAERRNNAQAIEVLEHLLRLDETLSDERETYAHVLEREGRAEDACEQYLKLIHQLKEDADPRQVIRYCRQILKESPNHIEAHTQLYRVYQATKKPRLALEEAQWLTDYYISTGDMEHAENYIRGGLAQSPGEIELRKRFVDILTETGRGEEAAANLKELAASAQTQGDVRTARWALTRACEVMPKNQLQGEPGAARLSPELSPGKGSGRPGAGQVLLPAA